MKSGDRGFRIYILSTMTIGVLLLAAVLALLIYGGVKVKSETSTLDKKVNNFNSQIKSINTNLVKIDKQLNSAKSLGRVLP